MSRQGLTFAQAMRDLIDGGLQVSHPDLGGHIEVAIFTLPVDDLPQLPGAVDNSGIPTEPEISRSILHVNSEGEKNAWQPRETDMLRDDWFLHGDVTPLHEGRHDDEQPRPFQINLPHHSEWVPPDPGGALRDLQVEALTKRVENLSRSLARITRTTELQARALERLSAGV